MDVEREHIDADGKLQTSVLGNVIKARADALLVLTMDGPMLWYSRDKVTLVRRNPEPISAFRRS